MRRDILPITGRGDNMAILAIGFIVETFIFGALIFYLDKAHRKETADLHLRLSSKSLEEYHYWRDGHELEVEHNKQVLGDIRREKDKTVEMTSAQKEAFERAKGF